MTETYECKKPEQYNECDWTYCEDGCSVKCQFCGGSADCICESCGIPMDSECDCGTEKSTICPTCNKKEI